MATESQRKKNFIAYYQANPEKLKGKSVYDAYAAMRREAGRQKKSPSAADRQAAVKNSAARKVATAYKPLTVGDGVRGVKKALSGGSGWRKNTDYTPDVVGGAKKLYAMTPKAQREARLAGNTPASKPKPPKKKQPSREELARAYGRSQR